MRQSGLGSATQLARQWLAANGRGLQVGDKLHRSIAMVPLKKALLAWERVYNNVRPHQFRDG